MSYRFSSTLPKLLIDSATSMPSCTARVSLWKHLGQTPGPSRRASLTYLDKKDTYCHIGIHPADSCYLRFCHNGTACQFTVLSFGLSTSLRVFTKILKPVLAYSHLHGPAWSQATSVSGRLIVKPRVTNKHPGAGLCSRANILAKVPVPKARVGCKLIYIRCMPIILSWTLLRV